MAAVQGKRYDGSNEGGLTRLEDAMTIAVLATMVLGSGVVNFLHWRLRRDERLFYYPSRGWLRVLFLGCGLATLALAILFWVGTASMVAFLSVLFGVNVAVEFYSLGYRQSRREHQLESNVA